MSISSTASTMTAQFQPTAPRKVDAESKVEGSKPDGDNDRDDKGGAVQSATTLATTGNIGKNINVVA